MEISNKEVLRYLRMTEAAADERIHSMVKEMTDFFSENIVPKSVYGIWDCQIDSSTVALGGMNIKSKNLAKHLAGCRRAVLLAATLGVEADTLIRRYSVQDMEKAVVAQAVCAAMIEAYCDKIESEFSQKNEFSGLYSTARFSPGYGDFDIARQKDILSLLNCGRIGLSMTDGYMLTPSKSVTAVIGFSDEKKRATELRAAGKCGGCADEQCKYREAM